MSEHVPEFAAQAPAQYPLTQFGFEVTPAQPALVVHAVGDGGLGLGGVGVGAQWPLIQLGPNALLTQSASVEHGGGVGAVAVFADECTTTTITMITMTTTIAITVPRRRLVCIG